MRLQRVVLKISCDVSVPTLTDPMNELDCGRARRARAKTKTSDKSVLFCRLSSLLLEHVSGVYLGLRLSHPIAQVVLIFVVVVPIWLAS